MNCILMQNCLIGPGWGGSPWPSEEDATARKWSRSDTGEADGCQPEAGREGKSPPKCEFIKHSKQSIS